ncbi:hypothetical protein PPL_01444 [Heterostelium album PN500]|uniref:Uncharacterized protein n=1 Tax=Heterostelium pallidum (strain ATCC 26659 / Pp 5 / PN500) TaxID=670386 RepID=D3AZA4_HETP5|nr:hypothetical protein PPL_01444 [Heterostelium album PN500]EFA85487.1 hypothetical protein PPL_01444 [Heterostelium album PN500]|eukprot:XP_020437595.1 hypothetical protein PPL_01444 [Heterostelium album PN500]
MESENQPPNKKNQKYQYKNNNRYNTNYKNQNYLKPRSYIPKTIKNVETETATTTTTSTTTPTSAPTTLSLEFVTSPNTENSKSLESGDTIHSPRSSTDDTPIKTECNTFENLNELQQPESPLNSQDVIDYSLNSLSDAFECQSVGSSHNNNNNNYRYNYKSTKSKAFKKNFKNNNTTQLHQTSSSSSPPNYVSANPHQTTIQNQNAPPPQGYHPIYFYPQIYYDPVSQAPYFQVPSFALIPLPYNPYYDQNNQLPPHIYHQVPPQYQNDRYLQLFSSQVNFIPTKNQYNNNNNNNNSNNNTDEIVLKKSSSRTSLTLKGPIEDLIFDMVPE